MPKSFAELQVEEETTIKDLTETLRDYAEGGAGIASHVVIEIIKRTKPNEEERKILIIHARKGEENQSRMNFPKEAAAYATVARFLLHS